jgi:hypothetical protein
MRYECTLHREDTKIGKIEREKTKKSREGMKKRRDWMCDEQLTGDK